MEGGGLVIWICLIAFTAGIEIYPPHQKIFVQDSAPSVTLPCNYRKAPLTPSLITWNVGGRRVLTVNAVRNSVPGEGFVGRARLGQGASLILISPTLNDGATYVCTVTQPSGINPTATGTVQLVVTDCVEPDIAGPAVCVALDIIALALVILWFALRGRPGIIREQFFRRILICLAIGSIVASVTSLGALIAYVCSVCVQDLARLRVAGIVFCVVGLVAALLCWLTTTRRMRARDESVSAAFDDDSDVSKVKPQIRQIDKRKAMIDGRETMNGRRFDDDLSQDRVSVPDDVIKIVGKREGYSAPKSRRFEELRTREHVDIPLESQRYLPAEPTDLSDVFIDDDPPGFARPGTYRSPAPSKSSVTSGSNRVPPSHATRAPPPNNMDAYNTEPTTQPTVAPVNKTEPTAKPTVAPVYKTEPTTKPTVAPVDNTEPTTKPTIAPKPPTTPKPTAVPRSTVSRQSESGQPSKTPTPRERINPTPTLSDSVPLKDKNSLRKARSEEVLKRGASLVTIPPERRSLPLSVEEKLDQDIFLEACKQTADYFVETAAYRSLEKHLLNEDTRGVTITGRAGDGKTASAMYAAWKLYSTAGFLPLKVRTVSEIERVYIEGLKLVFVLDEPFGQICPSSELQEYWMTCAKGLKAFLNTPNVKIIATVRFDIWNSCLFSVMRFIPFASAVSISAPLTKQERHIMLLKHLNVAGIKQTDPFWKQAIQSIVATGVSNGYPQCCQLVRTSDNLKQQADVFFRTPIDLLRKEIHTLRREDPVSFYILTLMVVYGGKLTRALLIRPLHELPNNEREKIESIWKACNRKPVSLPSPDVLERNVNFLCKMYIVKSETSLEFSLTTLAELVLLEMAIIDMNLLYKWCHPDVIVNKLIPEGCTPMGFSTSELLISVPSKHCSQFANVLTDQLIKGNIKAVLQNPAWGCEPFIECWNEEILTELTVGRIRGVHGSCCQGEVLHRAAVKGLLSMLKLLLNPLSSREGGTNIKNEYGQTLLHTAVIGGQVHVVQYLLQMGCAINAGNDAGESPLFLASLHGNMTTVQLLLDYEADPDQQTRLGIGPLHAAVFGDHTEIVWMLLSRVSPETLEGVARTKIGITSFRDRFLASLKHSGLQEAARTNDLVRIHHFLDNGFEKNDQNKYGWTPLYISVLLGHVDAAALFLTRGADATILSRKDFSSLDEACCAFNEPLIALLSSFSQKKQFYFL